MNADEKRIRDHIDKEMNQRIFDIVLSRSPNSLRLKITENESYSFDFDCELLKITFSENYYKLLTNLISKNKQKLIKLANLYMEKNRDFPTFLYDLVILVYFINELPDEFQRLLESDELQSEGDLMHNRILAQIAFNLRKKYVVTLNKKYKKKPSPDLTVDNFTVDIKTIIGRYFWTEDDFSKLTIRIDEKYHSAMKQTTNGIVFISFWSKNANNLFRDYFYSQLQTRPYNLENNSCYFVLDGMDALQDFYTSNYAYNLIDKLPSCNLIRNYSPMTSPSPFGMFQSSRKGFPITKTGPPNGFGISFSFG
ncbi:MAG: hypothetical protein IIB02_09430 [Thaumarchaeota archaeon]|nr:hypothetical protein [Nitrososphaerota archaeon]